MYFGKARSTFRRFSTFKKGGGLYKRYKKYGYRKYRKW